MPARPPCPACQRPVRRHDDYRAVGGVRYHLEHAPPGPGRPRTARGTGSRVVGVRLSAEEAAQVDADAAKLEAELGPRRGGWAAEVLRRAYLGT